MPLTMDMLREEHRNMSRLLDILGREVDRFERAEDVDYDLLTQIVDYFRSFPDLYHHPKEDFILRKLLERDPLQAEAFADLESQHEECSRRLVNLARAVVGVLIGSEVPRDRFVRIAREFINNERKHMAGEENKFFPAAMRHLSPDDWAEIDSRVSKFADPLSQMKQDMPHRYYLVREMLAGAAD